MQQKLNTLMCFFFMDRMRGENDHKSTYFELSPRLSLGEVSGKKIVVWPNQRCTH